HGLHRRGARVSAVAAYRPLRHRRTIGVAPCGAGDVHDERRWIAGFRRRRCEAAESVLGAARRNGGGRDGPEARGCDAGSGRADRSCAGAIASVAQVHLGTLIFRRLSFFVVVLVMVGACSSGSSSSSSGARVAVTPSPPPPISTEWTEYHGGPGRAGLGPAEPALSAPRVAWSAAVDGDVYASPLVVAGHVIVAT